MKADTKITVSVPDLGVAAFLKMKGYKIYHRQGKDIILRI